MPVPLFLHILHVHAHTLSSYDKHCHYHSQYNGKHARESRVSFCWLKPSPV